MSTYRQWHMVDECASNRAATRARIAELETANAAMRGTITSQTNIVNRQYAWVAAMEAENAKTSRMSALFEYEHTSWSENCPLCVQLKHRADAAIAVLARAMGLVDDQHRALQAEAALVVERGLVTSAHRAENAKQKALDTERHRAEQAEAALAEYKCDNTLLKAENQHLAELAQERSAAAKNNQH